MAELYTEIERENFLRKLQQDKNFAFLDEARQNKLLNKGIAYGANKAKAFAELYSSPIRAEDLSKLIENHHISVERVKTEYKLPFLAEYTPMKKTIELYPSTIEAAERDLSQLHPEYFEQYRLEELCLAHEFFHHIEYTDLGTTGRIAFVSKKLLGVFQYKHYFPELSEIAAHTFVKVLLNLKFSTYGFAEQLKEYYKSQKS